MGAGVWGSGPRGGLGPRQSRAGQVFEKAPVQNDPRMQHLPLESGHPGNSLSCGLVKILEELLAATLQLVQRRKGVGEGSGGGRSGGFKNKTIWRKRRRDADTEVERRPKAVHGFLDSWERDGISFLSRVGSCKTSATLRPETCDAPFPQRRLLLSPPLRLEWLEDRFLWGFALLGGDPAADAVRRFSPKWKRGKSPGGRSLPTFPHGFPTNTSPSGPVRDRGGSFWLGAREPARLV